MGVPRAGNWCLSRIITVVHTYTERSRRSVVYILDYGSWGSRQPGSLTERGSGDGCVRYHPHQSAGSRPLSEALHVLKSAI